MSFSSTKVQYDHATAAATASELLDRNACTTAGVALLCGTGVATLAVGMAVIPEVGIIGSVSAFGLAEVGRRQYNASLKEKHVAAMDKIHADREARKASEADAAEAADA